MMTFVSVGNATQPFSRLIDAVLKLASNLPQPVLVQRGNTIVPKAGCVVKPFLEIEAFRQFIEQAELLILHAGAGSIIHAIQAGKIPVVMPRLAKYGEHVDDHQVEFARALVQLGRIVVAEEPANLIDAIAEAQKRQTKTLHTVCTPPLVGLIRAVLCE